MQGTLLFDFYIQQIILLFYQGMLLPRFRDRGSLHHQPGKPVPAGGLRGDWRQRGQGQHRARLHHEDAQ